MSSVRVPINKYKSSGTACPCCGSSEAYPLDDYYVGWDYIRSFECEKCGTTWREIYSLKKVVREVQP